MRKHNFCLIFTIVFILGPLISIPPIMATESFSDINYDEPHGNYTESPPVYTINSSPEQPWKKTDVDFTGSIGSSDEYSIGFSKKINLNGQLPGKLAAVEGSIEVGFKIGFRYDVSFGYEFGVDYYHWANDMAVSEGQEFTYCTYVEPDPDTFSLWADISIEPFMSMWANIDVFLALAGYEIVDWDTSWSKDLSLPFSVSPNLDLGALLEGDLLTPIGELYSTPKIGIGLELPGRLDFGIGDWAGVYFDAGIGAYIQFQIRGLLQSLLEVTGSANAQLDGGKSSVDLKYYDKGKDNLQSINIHVPANSAGKIVEILAHEFKYSVEPGILLSWDGHVDLGAYLHIPTPTKYVKVAKTITETVCDWLPSPFGRVCDTVTKTVFEWVEVVETIVPDIDWSWDKRWEAEDEWWIPFFTIPLLKSNAQALDRITVLDATEHPLSITQQWSQTYNKNWTQPIGPSALRLSAYAGYALDLDLQGMLYSYFKPDDQIAGHPFNYYVGVDGDHADDGTFGGSLAAGYSLDLKIPYLNEWITLIGYDFNTSEFSNLDIPLFSAEYSVGYAAISLSSEADFADLQSLKIAQSANGFLGEWETEPFFSVGASLDGMLFQVISMNLGSVDVDFLFKGTGSLTGDISASGAGSFDSRQMQWDKPGDINYANIYPHATAEKGDIINVQIQNLTYSLDLSLVIRVKAKLYALHGYLEFTYDFEIPIVSELKADVNEDINDPIEVTSGFTPAKITEAPTEVVAGIPFDIKWETSNSSAGQTRLYYGQHPYPRTTYSDLTSNQSIPGPGLHEFSESIILNHTGIWYFAAHIGSTDPPFNYWSKNVTVLVRPRLNFTVVPENATAGETITVKWNIFGPSSVESTNVRVSSSPNPISASGTTTQTQAGSSGTYTAQIQFKEIGIYYLVAHAQVDKAGEDYYSEVVSITILPNITITVLPSPNNASFEFIVNWSIFGAYYVDRTYLEYSSTANFSGNVYSTVSQYGYGQNYHESIAIFLKGTWYLRVLASVNGIDDVYYSKDPVKTTQIDPYSEINPSYPRNVTAGESFRLYWWIFGYNSTVDKTQVFYDNDSNVFDQPLGSTIAHSGNTTDYSDIFSISEAGLYYFQANFSIDGESTSWSSSIISILVKPSLNVTSYPVNATGFTPFNISYILNGLNLNTTLVDLWYGETPDTYSMSPLITDVTSGTIQAALPITGFYYFAINTTFLGVNYWSEIFSLWIIPYIKVMVPGDQFSDVNPDGSPGQFAIAGIPVTIEWIVSNTTVVNHTNIHFRPDSRWDPELVPIIADYYKYDFTGYKVVAGLETPVQKGTGSTYYIFRQNVTFYGDSFRFVPFKVHVQCDDKTFNYYSNSSGIAVYPAAETIHYNYTVVVDKQDITTNPKNFTVTWGLGYEVHRWNDTLWNNTPNYPGIVPYKVVGIKHANIHYMLNYDPICPCVLHRNIPFNSTPIRSGPAYPAIFTDTLTISSVGTYYFRIHVKYQYSTTNENFTYPLHINKSYWSPLYKINVISYGKYNTSVHVPKGSPPPSPPVSYADYDGDGDLDMIVGDNSGTVRKIILYYNDGTGNYTKLPPKVIDSYIPPSNEEIISITAGYLNADTFLDFIMTNESMLGSTVRGTVYLNDGQCNFTISSNTFIQDSSLQASSHTIGDINADGIFDYIYYVYTDFSLYWDFGQPDGTLIPGGFFNVSLDIDTMVLADIDGNPQLDLVFGYSNGSLGIRHDFPGPVLTIPNISASFSHTNYPLIGDFNHDGGNDTIVVNTTGEVILTINYTSNPVNKVIGYAIAPPQGLAKGDFEADGDLDFVIGVGANQFQFFFSNYSITPSTWPGFSSQVVADKGNVLATGDFNNDSFIDISGYRGDYHILHFLYGYIPPPSITNIDVSYDSITQTINIENVTVFGAENEVINDTNAYFYWFSIVNGSFYLVSELDNLTWNGNAWEALNVNVTYLPEGDYYVNVTFGDRYTYGNNTYESQLSTKFTIDHYDEIHGVNVNYLDNTLQKLNITVDLVNCSYTELGNITGLEAAIHSFIIRNATGYEVLVYNNTLTGNLTYGNTTGTYRWEAINVSTAMLLPGDYFVSVTFEDYLGYDIITANSSLFSVTHVLISTSTPLVTYTGNLTQQIQIRNINIESSYVLMRNLGKGRALIYNYSIYDNATRGFTGLTGKLSYDGFSWYADMSVAALPEGSYFINAFFKDKFNATIMTSNSSTFTVDHTLDLSSLTVTYTGFLIQQFNISIQPQSTWVVRALLNDTEALTKTFSLYSINDSTPLISGDLTWTGIAWTQVVDVSQLLEGDYLVQVTFADSYANVTQNSSTNSVYHYIGISPPTVGFNSSTSTLSINNIIANSSYHGIVDNTTVVPSQYFYIIYANQRSGNITGTLTYNPVWHDENIDLTPLLYSFTFTVQIVFEVNESYGRTSFEFFIPPEKAPQLNKITPDPNTNGQIYLDWDDVNGATIYYIYRATFNITSVAGLTPIAVTTSSSYVDTVTEDATYFYVIMAGNSAGNTTISLSRSVAVTLSLGGGPNLFPLILIIGIGIAIAVISFIYIRKRRKLGKK
ncbi:MAG: FG-GAP-like repeat-containing protein [Candidatus Helarchaeota archaeon]